MNQIVKKKSKKKAFTLIELIIVLAIMAIIAAIAIPNFMAVRDNSRAKADIQSCETIKRTTLMLVSDGTIAAGTKAFVLTVPTVTGGTATEDTALGTAFKDVKVPQGKTLDTPSVTATKYNIDINDSGDVTVTTK